MLIAVLSDSHSNYRNIELALRRLDGTGVERILHCGDIADVQAVEMFRGLPTCFVFGNVDHDLAELRKSIEQSGNECLGRFGELHLAGRRIAMTHGDDLELLRQAERSGTYDVLCFGHTHRAQQHRAGRTLVVNPGALHRARTRTLALVDLTRMRCTHVPIEGSAES